MSQYSSVASFVSIHFGHRYHPIVIVTAIPISFSLFTARRCHEHRGEAGRAPTEETPVRRSEQVKTDLALRSKRAIFTMRRSVFI